MLNTVQIGDVGESYAIMKFTLHQCAVSKPLTNNVRYDLIVDINNRLYKVQVKTTGAVKDGKMEFATKTTNYSQGKWVSQGYSANEVDMFFLYCVENNWCGLYIPKEDETILKNFSVRVEPPKNNQIKGTRMAEDYCFEKQFGSLAQLAEQGTLNAEVEGSIPL